MKKISLIIPVYNAEKYLSRCLDSAVGQTYSNLEVICINDGSTDASLKILEGYAQKYRRVRLVSQENKGESAARNKGLRMAEGEYIGFLDCDDWIESDMYESLVAFAEENSLDMAASAWYKETESDSIRIKNSVEIKDNIFGREKILNFLYMRDSYRGMAYMWNKVYRRELILSEKSPLFFNEDLKLGGDVQFLAETALRINRCGYMDRAFYHYRQREDSGCHTRDMNRLADWIKVYEIVIERFNESGVEKDTIDYVKRFLGYHCSNFAELACRQKEPDHLRKFQNYMNKYKEIYLELNSGYPERIERYEAILKYHCQGY